MWRHHLSRVRHRLRHSLNLAKSTRNRPHIALHIKRQPSIPKSRLDTSVRPITSVPRSAHLLQVIDFEDRVHFLRTVALRFEPGVLVSEVFVCVAVEVWEVVGHCAEVGHVVCEWAQRWVPADVAAVEFVLGEEVVVVSVFVVESHCGIGGDCLISSRWLRLMAMRIAGRIGGIAWADSWGLMVAARAIVFSGAFQDRSRSVYRLSTM